MTCVILSLMDTVGAAYFKEHCLALLESVTSEGLIITKHGQPVAKLIPFSASSGQWIGSLKSKIKIKKKNLMCTGLKWDAES